LDRPFGADQFYGDFNSWERTKTWYAALQQDLGTNTSISLSYRRHTDLFVLLRNDPSYYTNHHVDTAWDTALRRHDRFAKIFTLSYGAEGLAENVNSTNLGVHDRQRGAAYADLDVRALGKFSISVGAREEVYGSGQTVFAPSASAGYWLSDKIKLRASAGRAYRLPNFTDLYYHDPATVGNPFLQPESAIEFEGGVDFHPGFQTRLSAAVFQRRDHNGIDYVRSSPDTPWTATNFDNLRFTGVELLAEKRLPHSQQISVQFTGIHGAQAESPGLQSRYLFNYPSQQAVINWQILTRGNLLARTQIGVLNRYQQPAYGLWNAYAAWTRWRVRPYLQLTNLTDTIYEEVPSVTMPGRAFVAGIEICAICKER
jgi:iron complex outermembrane receptor protein